jgi:hypothetical protein
MPSVARLLSGHGSHIVTKKAVCLSCLELDVDRDVLILLGDIYFPF